MKYYWVKDTDRKISARSLTLVISAAVCMGSSWSTISHTSLNDATAVIFCKMFLIRQNSTLPGNTFLESNLLHTLYTLTSIYLNIYLNGK